MAPQPAPPTPPPGVEPAGGGEPGAEGLVQARRLGLLEGEAWDCRYREAERRDRESRLALTALRADAAGHGPASVGTAASTADIARLRAQVEALSAFHTAVVRSRSWRLLQGLRRLVGRAW
jgi:hypothetical protein